MAKNQNLALNPQKLSGLCGRLMCCLVFEDDLYKKLRKDMPKVGSTIDTPRGAGKVLNADILGRRIQVQLEQATVDFTIGELRGEEPPSPRKPDARAEASPGPERASEGPPGEGRPKEGRRRRKRRSKTGQKQPAQPAASKPETQAGQPGKSKEGEDARAQDPAGKKRRKRRSRRRSRRRKKKAPGEGGQAAKPGGEGAD
jgi:hypothetical protein